MQDEVLSQLRDVHLPKEPSWWPPAIGYYLSCLLLVLIILLAVFYYRRTEPGRKIKKQLMKEIDAIQAQFLKSRDHAYLQAELSGIVRRLMAYKQYSPQLLSSELLDLEPQMQRLFPQSKNTSEFFALLHKERYQKEPDIDAQRFIHCARELVKKCRI